MEKIKLGFDYDKFFRELTTSICIITILLTCVFSFYTSNITINGGKLLILFLLTLNPIINIFRKHKIVINSKLYYIALIILCSYITYILINSTMLYLYNKNSEELFFGNNVGVVLLSILIINIAGLFLKRTTVLSYKYE